MSRQLLQVIFYSLLLIIPVTFVEAAESAKSEWALKKDKDGIRVYIRKIEGRMYREFKGIVEIETTLTRALALLDDSDACEEWLYRCESARILQRSGLRERHVYQVTNLPFPAATRDAIIKVTLLDYQTGRIRVDLQSTPDFIPATSLVRIRDSYGTYLLEQLDEHHMRLTWTQYVNPAGNLPAFVVNALLTDVPFKSLKNFRETVQKEKYRNARFIYDESGTPVDLSYGEVSK